MFILSGFADEISPSLDEQLAVLGTAIVRVFSFFIPPGEPPERHRQRLTGSSAPPARPGSS